MSTWQAGCHFLAIVATAARTTPLRGLWQHPPYFHDGRAPTPDDVVAHYDRVLGLGLQASQREEPVEYLKTL